MQLIEANKQIKSILMGDDLQEIVDVFAFDKETSESKILKKFKLFARRMYPTFFKAKSPDFHDHMIILLIRSYFGKKTANIAYRGSAKTSIVKLFVAFVILCDVKHYRSYIKVLTRDLKNSRQFVTDVYNMLVEARWLFGNVFEKENKNIKREETQGGFTLKTLVKVLAGTVGQTQRGHVQGSFRPDWIIFDDIEDRETISSIVMTEKIIEKVDEAITGLSITPRGSYVLNGNYISDEGSVQWLLDRVEEKLITPIATDIQEDRIDGVKILTKATPTWPEIFTLEEINKLMADSLDFYGEFMCDPSNSSNKFFDQEKIRLDLEKCEDSSRESAGVKYWGSYKPNSYYAIGADTAGGVGRDSCTMIGFDFRTGEQVLRYASNEIPPDIFAYEMIRVGQEFGNCLLAPELNNTGQATVAILKSEDYPSIYRHVVPGTATERPTRKYGWDTNKKTKPIMFFDFKRDYEAGLITIKDAALLKEMKAYTKADFTESSSGLVTRHFDLLIAACIAWQMKSVIMDYGAAQQSPIVPIW